MFQEVNIVFGDLKWLDYAVNFTEPAIWRETRHLTFLLSEDKQIEDSKTLEEHSGHFMENWQKLLHILPPINLTIRNAFTDPHQLRDLMCSPKRQILSQILHTHQKHVGQLSTVLSPSKLTLDFSSLALHRRSCIWQEIFALKDCVTHATLRAQVRGKYDSTEEDEAGDLDLNTAEEVNFPKAFAGDSDYYLDLQFWAFDIGLDALLRESNSPMNLTCLDTDLDRSTDLPALYRILHSARKTLHRLSLYIWLSDLTFDDKPLNMGALRDITLINADMDEPGTAHLLLKWLSCPVTQHVQLNGFLTELESEDTPCTIEWMQEINQALPRQTILYSDTFTVSKREHSAALLGWENVIVEYQSRYQRAIIFDVRLILSSFPADLALLNTIIPVQMRERLVTLTVTDRDFDYPNIPDMTDASISWPNLVDLKIEFECRSKRTLHRLPYLLTHLDMPNLDTLTLDFTADRENERCVDEHAVQVASSLRLFSNLTSLVFQRRHFVSHAACLLLRETCKAIGAAFEENYIVPPPELHDESISIFD